MNKLVMIALMSLSLAPLSAKANPSATSTKRDIQRLARSIDEALLDSTSGESDLREAREKMEQALKLIRQGGGSAPGSIACIDYAYAKYSQSSGSATAMDKAAVACRKVDSVEVMQFLFEKYSQSSGSSTAMDQAAAGSVAPIAGKLQILKFAYEKYSQSQGSATAANSAVAAARAIRQDNLRCVEVAYSRYAQSMGSASAMNASVTACQ